MKQAKTRRRRGVVLTPQGLQRLQAAIVATEIAENRGNRFTLEELGDRVSISTKTLSRLWSLNLGVDQKTIRLCFSAFNLELRRDDYAALGDESLPEEEPAEEIVQLNGTPQSTPLPPFSLGEGSVERDLAGVTLPYPDGPVPLNSKFYIDRPPNEALAYQVVTQPGCVIRIRAPKEMGKSSLVLRLLTFAEAQHYATVNLDCNQIDLDDLNDLNKFLRGFCLRVARELRIDPSLDTYWDEEIGSKLSCSFYFKNHLLKQLRHPVVLVLNEIDRLFEYPLIAQEFFPLLRSWYEEARRDSPFQKLRLVVVYSTEEYAALDINRSPFNVGLPLRLPQFTQAQVQDLVRRHGLSWQEDEIRQLMQLVGGHPALIRIALYFVCCHGISLDELLQQSLGSGSIFHYHLWRHWLTLQENPDLAEAMALVVSAPEGVSLDPVLAYKLESQGLVRYEGDRVKPCCELYRAYFRQQLSMR